MPGDIAKDMTNFRSGMLTVLGRGPTPKGKRAFWLCVCDCGTTTNVMGKYLRLGNVKSCGCLNRRPFNPDQRSKHQHSRTGKISPTYHSWSSMLDRCRNPKNRRYPDYGGRGIFVYGKWSAFENFLKDMGIKPEGTSLHRIDNEKGYSPENCKWADAYEQANEKRTSRKITFRGETLSLTQWAERIGIGLSALHARLKTKGIKKALTQKVRITKLTKHRSVKR